MPDLPALIERVEALTGPDRQVDAEVMFDLLATPVGQHKEDGGPIGYIRIDDQPSWNFGLRFPGKDRAWFQAARKQIKGETLLIERDGAYVLMNSLRIPEITASLDAAIALVKRVLPGWTLYASITDGTADDLYLLGPNFRDGQPEQNSSPPVGGKPVALALTLATLRALHAQEGRDG